MKAGAPAFAELGEMLVSAGGGGEFTVSVTAFDEAPPGFATVTCTGPACVRSVAGSAAWTSVELTKVAARVVPFTTTLAPVRKPVPVTVKTNGVPTFTLVGEILVMVGRGAVIVRVTLLDAAPPAFAAVICADPGCVIMLAGTAAVSCLALTKVVVKAVLLNDTVAPARKFVPVTVRVKAAPPDVTVDGERLVIVGAGGAIVSATALDAAPPVFDAVICADPAA